MKKTIILMILPIAALMAATPLIGTPEHTGMRLMERDIKAPEVKTGRVFTDEELRMIGEETDYYMERHNVQDEGYEMVVAFAGGKRLEMKIDDHVDVRNVGTWKGHRREGTAVALDSLGRTIIGYCDDDSLKTGWRLDPEGTYKGDFHKEKPEGHGAYLTPEGGYFEGHWENGLRQGFGLELLLTDGEDPRLRVGEWSKGRFQGERMKYTSERIYGIDIARYQHGKGRRPVAIQWNKLRITHVGKRGSQNVSGTADYPVSFVYIKSTEGTSIRNKFYPGDYAKARKQGIRTGAYHFWSMRSSGEDQAKHFLKNTHFKAGDLPPVLDIEPSKAQIEQSGGEERMFRQIRTWLRKVEQRTGVKPILYVNQMFVNNYLTKQADLKRDYRVWIARYSEYKPDVRLTYWQLCPDGRVAGIQGDVDINVFNGYKSQFEEFVEKEGVRL